MARTTNARVQVITGPMFAGKSEELQRRVRRAQIAGLAVEVVNHSLDRRHGTREVSSHAGSRIRAHSVPDVDALRAIAGARRLDLLAIDEAQFFGAGLIEAVDDLARDGTTVVVSGLCVTYDGRPFEPLPSLMALAEDVVKLTAVCSVCGDDAAFHQRIAAAPGASDGAAGDTRRPSPEHVGGVETYQARCRMHVERRG